MNGRINGYRLSSSLLKIQKNLEELKLRCISDPGNAEEILSDALEQLQVTFEELSAADEELMQQNEELIVAEEALRESEEKYRLIVETANEGIWMVDRDARIIFVNPKLAEIFGYSPKEMLGKTAFDLMDDEGKEIARKKLEQSKQGIKGSHEFKYIRMDGSPLWAMVNATPIVDKDSKFAGSLAMLTDITERKLMEEALQVEKDILQAIMEDTNAQIAYLDPQFNFIKVNSPYVQGCGHSAEELIGRNHFNLFPNEENEAIFKKVVETGEPVWFHARPFEYIDQPERGVTYWDWSLVPVKDDAGQIKGLVFSLLDVTSLKRIEEELRRSRDELELKVQERTAELSAAKENLEAINKELQAEIIEHEKTEKELIAAKEAAEAAAETKAAFMANMSHELRTPMNYIVGMTSLLLDEPLTPELKDYIETIRKGGDEMMALINDILDFSKIEKEKVVLEYLPLSLRALIEESMEMVASHATKKGLNIVSTIKYGTPDYIVGDQGRLRQVLISLLSNAIKFTDEGDISVTVSSKPLQKSNKQQILFAVKDTGIGIPPEKMAEIFQPFSQVETTLSRKRDGVGLGLAANKKLVELMGGEIWARSEVGKGSAFCFTMEAEIASSEGIKAKPERMTKAVPDVLAEQHPLRILVAEDIPSNQKALLEMLKRMGYRADAVADGKEVLQALEMRTYDLILMDIKMPEMDGIEATKEIRRRGSIDEPKIIAITAYALAGDREKCLAAGMDDYISKPIQKEELAKVLMKYG